MYSNKFMQIESTKPKELNGLTQEIGFHFPLNLSGQQLDFQVKVPLRHKDQIWNQLTLNFFQVNISDITNTPAGNDVGIGLYVEGCDGKYNDQGQGSDLLCWMMTWTGAPFYQPYVNNFPAVKIDPYTEVLHFTGRNKLGNVCQMATDPNGVYIVIGFTLSCCPEQNTRIH